MAHFMALMVSAALLAILVLPPVFALRMSYLRLRDVLADRRMPYQALVALSGLVLVFNLLVWAGMPTFLRGLLPDLIDRNLGYAALLASWGAVGLCALLAVLHPRRQRSSV